MKKSQLTRLIKQVGNIKEYIEFSLNGTVYDIPEHINMNQMLLDFKLMLTEKAFLEKYCTDLTGLDFSVQFDDDDFNEKGEYHDNLELSKNFIISFNDRSELEITLRNFHFQYPDINVISDVTTEEKNANKLKSLLDSTKNIQIFDLIDAIKERLGIVQETVIFRKFKEENDIIAIFPYDIQNIDKNYVMSYMHVGQHSECSIGLINNEDTYDAYEHEYVALLEELKSIGYELTVITSEQLDYEKYLRCQELFRKQYAV